MKTAALTDLINIFLDKLANSKEINEWCRRTYGKDPHFIVGMDYNCPPSSEDCPYMVLAPIAKQEGNVSAMAYSMAIAWSIHNENISTEGNITRFQGIDESDQLGQKIIKEITNCLQNSSIDTIEYTLDGITQYPQFPGEISVSIKVLNTIGGKIIF